MKCKRSIMGFAAILVLIFHFYIPVTGLKAETVLMRACYIGVDLFFFVSAYSLAQRKDTAWLPFMKNRLIYTYLPFVFFAFVGALYEGWKVKKFLRVIFFVELFKKGGGSFVWFLPGILLIYLIAPFLVRLRRRFSWAALAGMMAFWLVLTVVLQYGFGYTDLFILLNRLPVFFLGLYYDEIREKLPNAAKLPLIIASLLIGGFLVWKFGSLTRLMKPLKDLYYLIALPLILGFAALFDWISARTKVRNVPLQFIGNYTLEIYALQMIFGYDLESYLLKATGSLKFLSFLLTVILLIAAGFLVGTGRSYITKKLLKK